MKTLVLIFVMCVFPHSGNGQGDTRFRGRVVDMSSEIPVRGVAVFVEDERSPSSFTDSLGYFSIPISSVPFVIDVVAPGFKAARVIVEAAPESVVVIRLKPQTYMLDEVVVTATRVPLARGLSPSRIFTISNERLRAENADHLGESLIGKPGLVMRQYGGGGDLQLASFRGMGAEHTAVLLDGMPLGNVQTGLTDLRLIPLDHVERVELLRGGSSAAYGSGAVGGVVNILTNPAAAGSFARFEASAGSFGVRRFSFSTQAVSADDFGVTFGSSTEYGSGDYAFAIEEGGKQVSGRRKNSDYRVHHIFAKGRWEPSRTNRSTLFVSSYAIGRGTPGPVLLLTNQGLARQSDNQFLVAASHQTDLTESLQWSVAANLQNSYERYVNPAPASPADNFYRNILMTFASNVRYEFSGSILVHAGVEGGNAFANGNALEEQKTRPHFGIFVSSALHTGVSNLTVSMYPHLRYDRYGAAGQAVSPRLGLNIRLDQLDAGPVRDLALTLHSTFGRDFRVPTINHLYYAGAGGRGNPNLEPERSTSFDVGFSIDYFFMGRSEIDLTYYSIRTDNRILWLPTSSPFIWSPVNMARTLSTGYEIEFIWSSVDQIVTFEGNYASLDAWKKFRISPDDPTFGKQLIYVPLETGSIGVKVSVPFPESVLSEAFFWIRDAFTGERFIVEDNTLSLPAYHLLTGNAGVELRLFETSFRVKYEVGNILNQAYEVIPRFPMPLRSHGVSLSVQKTY